MATVIMDIYFNGSVFRMPWEEIFKPDRVRQVENMLTPKFEFYKKYVPEQGHIFLNWYNDKVGNEFELFSPDLDIAMLINLWNNRTSNKLEKRY